MGDHTRNSGAAIFFFFFLKKSSTFNSRNFSRSHYPRSAYIVRSTVILSLPPSTHIILFIKHTHKMLQNRLILLVYFVSSQLAWFGHNLRFCNFLKKKIHYDQLETKRFRLRPYLAESTVSRPINCS